MDILKSWSVAIFAHNEAKTIIDCLNSVIQQDLDALGGVYVLVNGSQDATEKIVSDYAVGNPKVTVVRLSLADKASAWNHYVHDICSGVDVHFFVDGDIVVTPNSFRALTDALRRSSGVRAAGALPVTGRDHTGMSRRMVAFGQLAGGLYALRGQFISELQNQGIRMPAGLIGEDLLLSCLVKDSLNGNGIWKPSPRLVFATDAGFIFEPLALNRPRDWIKYSRRLVRYRIRGYQLSMLFRHLATHPQLVLPPDVGTLYQQASELPNYFWRGRITPFDMLAVWRIRRAARKHAIA